MIFGRRPTEPWEHWLRGQSVEVRQRFVAEVYRAARAEGAHFSAEAVRAQARSRALELWSLAGEDEVCVCGHPVGEHDAELPHRCLPPCVCRRLERLLAQAGGLSVGS